MDGRHVKPDNREQIARGAQRLRQAVAELPLRYAPFFGSLSELWAVPREVVELELTRARHPRSWSTTRLIPGLETFDVARTEPSAGRARLLRFAPGARFPHHCHVGDEQALVLEGSFADEGGREVRPGERQTMRAGSSHELRILGSVTCVTAVFEQGVELTSPWLSWANRWLR